MLCGYSRYAIKDVKIFDVEDGGDLRALEVNLIKRAGNRFVGFWVCAGSEEMLIMYSFDDNTALGIGPFKDSHDREYSSQLCEVMCGAKIHVRVKGDKIAHDDSELLSIVRGICSLEFFASGRCAGVEKFETNEFLEEAMCYAEQGYVNW